MIKRKKDDIKTLVVECIILQLSARWPGLLMIARLVVALLYHASDLSAFVKLTLLVGSIKADNCKINKLTSVFHASVLLLIMHFVNALTML